MQPAEDFQERGQQEREQAARLAQADLGLPRQAAWVVRLQANCLVLRPAWAEAISYHPNSEVAEVEVEA